MPSLSNAPRLPKKSETRLVLKFRPRQPLRAYRFFRHVVLTNGHTVHGDTVTLDYGASDEFICGATLSIKALLASLHTE